MQGFAVDKYISDGFINPADDVPPSERNADWYKAKCEYIYSLYLRDRTGIPYSRLTDYETFRMYARGMQPVEKYKDYLCPKDKKTAKRRSWMNISWDILPVLPKFRDVVIGMFDKIEYKASANAIDELSDEMRSNMKFKIWAEQKEQEWLAQFDSIAGTKPDEDAKSQPAIPTNLQELDMLEEMGAFKLKHEIAMEKAIKLSDYNSDWKETKKQLIEDFIDLGIAATKDYVDIPTQKVMSRYVDPVNLIVRYDRQNDFSSITEAGELKLFSMQSIQELTGLPEDEVRQIATLYNGWYGNPKYYYNNQQYQQNKVLVLDCEFASLDTKVFQKRLGANGVPIMFEEDPSFNKQSNEKRTVTRAPIQQWFRCKWIVGTDHVFDYGYQYDVPRPRKSASKPRSSYHIYRCNDRSMMEKCVVTADMIQLNHLRLQNDMAKAPPAGIRVEWGSLNNMTLGGEKLSPMDILAIYRQTGDVLYKATTIQGNMVQGAPDPIQELEGGMGRILDERIKIFEYNLNLIRDVTGINEIADASEPKPGALNGTSQMALAATNNALSPLLMGYRYLRQETAKNVSLRTQIVAMNGMIEGELPALGSANIEIIKLGAEDGLTLADFGIMVEAVPTDEDKALIMGAAQQSLAANKQGSAGINMSDFMFIKRCLDNDNIKYAEFILASREQQEYDKQRQLQAENMQMNQQGAQAAEQQKAQGAQQLMQMQTQFEMQKLDKQTQDTITIDDHKTANMMKLKQFEAQLMEQYGQPGKTSVVETL